MSREEMGRRVYVGELPTGADERDIKSALRSYGEVESVWVHGRGTYAFVTFRDRRDAEDAVRSPPKIRGARARLEIARRERRTNGPGGAFNDRRDDRCFSCGRSGHYAHDCPDRGGRYGGGGGSGGASRRRSRSRDRDLDRGRDRRSRSRTRSRSPADNNADNRRRRYSGGRSSDGSRSRSR